MTFHRSFLAIINTQEIAFVLFAQGTWMLQNFVQTFFHFVILSLLHKKIWKKIFDQGRFASSPYLRITKPVSERKQYFARPKTSGDEQNHILAMICMCDGVFPNQTVTSPIFDTTCWHRLLNKKWDTKVDSDETSMFIDNGLPTKLILNWKWPFHMKYHNSIFQDQR